jgi:fibronectin-binding autotransporter adhesin
MNRGCLFLGFVIGIVFSSHPTAAQYTADFQTNIISGVTSNWSGDYAVGNSFSADVLFIQSNGLLSDGFGYLGFSPTTSNNSAFVTDSGSTWSNEYGFYVGNNNSIGNSLVISNGGHVVNGGGGFVGQGSVPKITSNTVVLTDNGSVWSNHGWLVVGYPGSGNRVVVRNGALLANGDSRVGAYITGSSNNSVVVSDPGSVWTSTGNLYVGDRGVSNSVTLTNGGKAFCAYAYVGNEIGASTNSLQVTGAGSVWSNWFTLNIGFSGAGNSLSILSSGTLTVASDASAATRPQWAILSWWPVRARFGRTMVCGWAALARAIE